MKNDMFVKIKVIALVFLIFLSHSVLCITSAVTYTFSGGRLGDNLLSYCHAKWISYTYNIPLLYKPFGYSEQLMLDLLEIPYSDDLESQFEAVITYSIDTQIDPKNGCLYVIPFFPESIFNRYDKDCPYLFTVDWEDQAFKSLLQAMIAPINPAPNALLWDESITVAIHVRKGTGWDIPNYRITPEALTASHPLRFAPDSFYIEQLKKIVGLFPGRKIYVYLFTDHDNPGELADKYAQVVACDRMTIDYRRSENNEFINVLDDFFALQKFDCLIRADSNFSFIASKLGNYKVQISPWHGYVTQQGTLIDEVQLIIENQSFVVKEQASIKTTDKI
jgi:hypothetical protein